MRTAYEPLIKKKKKKENDHDHRVEHHYSSSKIEIMEPETYASSVGSTIAPSSTAIPISIVSSSTTATQNPYETRSSSSRRHHQSKKRSHHVNPSENGDERIEVKILPQDDNWGETTTTTCHGANEDTMTNTNDISLQLHEHHANDPSHGLTKKFSRSTSALSISNFIIYLLCFIGFITPLFFLTLPFVLVSSDTISITDYSNLMTILFKMIFLLLGTLFLLYRRRNSPYLPRIHLQKLLLIIVLTTLIVCFWMHYIWKIFQVKMEKYDRIISFTSIYEDLLLSLLFLTVLILEVKGIYPRWIVKVVRSPDGQTRQYTIGNMSIQEAAIYLLEQYYKDFPVFNPWLENAQQTQARRSGGAFSSKSIGSQSNSSTVNGDNGTTTRSIRGFNDRFYDELDYERRVRKRRTKLLSSCEDAFNHVRKCLNEKTGSHVPMDAREAAQAVFSSMSRSLQKYLRLTRQQPYFTRESIISHLATCLSHDLSPRAFLERYVQTESQPLATLLFPALASTNANQEQSWTLLCDTDDDERRREQIPLNQSIQSNLIFVLKQQHAEHIALICTFHPIPKVNLIERILDVKQNKFVLKLNSETSV